MIVKLRLGLAIVVIAMSVFAVIFYRAHTPAPTFNVSPIQKNPRALLKSEVENLLGSQFLVVRRVRQVPPALKQSFTNFTGLPFDMNDPGERLGTDFIVPGIPSRRLVFAGVSNNSAVLVYEQGGYATTLNAVIFSYADSGGAWRAILYDRSIDNVLTVKSAVGNGRFRNLENRN